MPIPLAVFGVVNGALNAWPSPEASGVVIWMRVILPFFTEKRPSPLSPLTAPLTRNRHRNGSEQSPLALPQAALPEARPAPSFTPAMLLPTTIVLFLNVGNAASAAGARPRMAPRV